MSGCTPTGGRRPHEHERTAAALWPAGELQAPAKGPGAERLVLRDRPSRWPTVSSHTPHTDRTL